VCEDCKNVDFGFESTRAPLRYEGAGKKMVHALKYGGYTRVVEKVAAPLMLGVRAAGMRFDAVVPEPLNSSRIRQRGVQPGKAPGERRRPKAQRTRIGYTRSHA
jgi:predicted amidophosphoribosyltransferase